MTDAMKKERLARLEATANADVYGLLPGEARELVTEVHRLRDREKALHEALRHHCIRKTGHLIDADNKEQPIYGCAQCFHNWSDISSVNHAPGCLAAPMEDER